MNGLIVADTNEKRTNQQLSLAGFRNLTPAKKWENSVVDGIRWMKQFTLIVDPGSPEVGESLNEYKWLEEKSETPSHAFSHIPDSIRYPFVLAAVNAGFTRGDF